MTVLFILVPMALILAGGAVVAFLWAVRNGQMDDLTTPALRILHEERPQAVSDPAPGAPSPPARRAS